MNPRNPWVMLYLKMQMYIPNTQPSSVDYSNWKVSYFQLDNNT